MVAGYVGDNALLPKKTNEDIFPADVKNTITIFLFQIEKFIKGPDTITITNDDTIATINDEVKIPHPMLGLLLWRNHTIHCQFDIKLDKYPNAIYKWKFRLGADRTSIGIESDTNREHLDDYIFPCATKDKSRYFYAIGERGYLLYSDSTGEWNPYNVKKYCDRFDKGDILEMILNVADKTMLYHHCIWCNW